ncbi:hypothetical protein O9K51_10560 [Purpureocillium lavendulum]|uniref:Uncharacterized protein n=1 Tax=Purpureocillium lavendulum TaxID=1247861 RepID=A0AB34FC68_9HYPO|nr:hypothetical protein O9K51_10560 [Purpureocillium lavendulum]
MVLAQDSLTGRLTPDLRKRRAASASRETGYERDNLSHKKRKLDHPAFPPPGFWDRLSYIPLTRRALREGPRRDELKPAQFAASKERITVSHKENFGFPVEKRCYPEYIEFTNDDFRKFERADTHAAKERDVTTTVIPIIEGNAGDRKCVAGQIPFTNLGPLTDGTLVPGNPDLYYGARPEQLKRTVRSELNKMIMPSTQQDLPIVPNFSLAVKGPDGSFVQSYGQTPTFDNRAYAITSIYHGGTLKMYTSHPIPPSAPKKGSGFAMTQIKAWVLTGDADTFRRGAGAYRNLQEWAKKERDNVIEKANERLPQNSGASPSQDAEGLTFSFTSEASAADTIVTSQTTLLHADLNAQTTYESDSSDDPLSRDFQPLDFEPPAKRTKSRSRSPRKQA